MESSALPSPKNDQPSDIPSTRHDPNTIRRSDVQVRLGAANLAELSLVRAVVLETTRDVNVRHGSPHAVEVTAAALT